MSYGRCNHNYRDYLIDIGEGSTRRIIAHCSDEGDRDLILERIRAHEGLVQEVARLREENTSARSSACYCVRSENLTGLDRHTGWERLLDNWVKYTHTIEAAKRLAEQDYQTHAEKPLSIVWSEEDGEWHTQDLLFVQYHIEALQIEQPD